jgi:hypothetical protein
MAKELGFKPRSLLKNIPSPHQPWKAPVAEWVCDLYERRQRRTEQRRRHPGPALGFVAPDTEAPAPAAATLPFGGA